MATIGLDRLYYAKITEILHLSCQLNPYKNRRYLTCQLNPITFRAVDMLPQTIKIRVS